MNLELPPHIEFALRTQQQSAQGLSRQEAIDLLTDYMRRLATSDYIIVDLIKEKWSLK